MQEAQSFSSTCGVKTLQVSSTTLLFHYSSCCLLCTQITFFLYFQNFAIIHPSLSLTPVSFYTLLSSKACHFFHYFTNHTPLLFHFIWCYTPPPPTLFISYSPYLPTDIIFPHTHLLNLFLVLLCSCTYPPPLPMSYWLTPSPLNPKHPTDLPHPQLVLYIT